MLAASAIVQTGHPLPVGFGFVSDEQARPCKTLADAPQPYAITGDVWASKGFIYVSPPMPLDFARTPGGPLTGMAALADQAVDALVERGYVDKDQVVLFGFSQGGYLLCRSQPNRENSPLSFR